MDRRRLFAVAVEDGLIGQAPTTRVRVQMYGEEYIIRGQATPEYMEDIAALVDARLKELVERHKNIPFHRLAVLAAFHFADELVRAQQENKELLELIHNA